MKVGDIVILKSGGPKMTVNGFLINAGQVQTIWFDADEKVQSSYFIEAALKLVKAKK